jgi:hypothetical protein
VEKTVALCPDDEFEEEEEEEGSPRPTESE